MESAELLASLANVLGMLLLGFRAPMAVAMGFVFFLGLLYLQEILQHDVKMAGSIVLKLDTEEDLQKLEEELKEQLKNGKAVEEE